MSERRRRKALLHAVVPPLAAGVIRLIWKTARVKFIRREMGAAILHAEAPFIIAFWHCQLLLMPYSLQGRERVTVLISQHGDGELIARTIARFGHPSARGSSRKGGVQVLREALRIAKAGDPLAITPDGPRGPARVVKPGVAEIARLTGAPILPCALAARPVRRMRSWDRFEVPLPFSRVALAYGEPMRLERDADDAARAALCVRLATCLDDLTRECEQALGARGGAS
jgi:lysophospholipid acyltransferase (LPLAT)-like uncharacterized protein